MRALTKRQAVAALVDISNGMTKVAVARKYGVSVRTIFRLCSLDEPERKPRELKPCGTVAALRRHRRKNEYPCTACLAAGVEYNRRYSRAR